MADVQPKVSILFVCMGNICRSPSAEWMFRQKVKEAGMADSIAIASAGTLDFHVGKPADERSAEAAKKRGIDLSHHQARALDASAFNTADYLLVMDKQNYEDTLKLCPPGSEKKVRYFMDFAPELGIDEVPDPYHGGSDGFENVLDLLEAASEGFITYLQFHDLQASF